MHDHSLEAHMPGGWVMSKVLVALRPHPCRTIRPTTVPAEALGIHAFGTGGTVGTVE